MRGDDGKSAERGESDDQGLVDSQSEWRADWIARRSLSSGRPKGRTRWRAMTAEVRWRSHPQTGHAPRRMLKQR